MARSERITLEPEEVALPGRIEIDIHDGAIQVGKEGPDWGDYEVNAFLAKQKMGLIPVDEEIPNRTITIPLILGATGDFDAARIAIEAWAAKVNHQGGGHLKREIIGGSYGEAGKKGFFDCVKATLSLGGGTPQAKDGVDPEALLTIEALPEFYGEWVTEESFEATGGGSNAFQVIGTLPARAELTVTDKSGKDQMGVGWFVRCANFSEAPTAAWRYEAEALKVLDAASEVSLTGASGGKTIRHNNLGTNWTPVLSLRLKAGTYLTHAGLYDVWARVYTTSSEPPWLRLLHDTGDIVAPASNPQAQVPDRNGFYLVPLGQIYLDPLPFGDHRWHGVIQARGASGGENIHIDQVELHCADEASGIILGRQPPSEPFAASYLVRDEFNQSAGNATGKSPAFGSAYTALPGSDATDFTISEGKLIRTSVSDTGEIGVQPPGYPTGAWRGRGIGTNSEPTNVAARCDFTLEGDYFGDISFGFVLSYVNDDNFVIAHLGGGVSGWYLGIFRADNEVSSYSRPLKVFLPESGIVSGSIVAVVRGNRLTFFCAKDGEQLREEATIENSMIGVKGKVYLFDQNVGATAITRDYDNFSVWTPEGDAAIFASRDLRIAHHGVYRPGGDGVGYGPPATPGNDLLRLPVSGPEERPVEVGVRTSCGNFGVIPDSNLGLLKAQLAYRPCWSQVPSF